MGFLYVMECAMPTGGTVCKVGVSEHDPNRRRQAIQTGCPFEIGRMWVSKNIPDYRQCEQEVHDQLSRFRTHGEWFEVDFKKASITADKVCKTDKDQLIEKKIAQLEEVQKQIKRQLNEIDGEIELLRYDLRGCVM